MSDATVAGQPVDMKQFEYNLVLAMSFQDFLTAARNEDESSQSSGDSVVIKKIAGIMAADITGFGQ